MNQLTIGKTREIINDFAEQIQNRKREGKPPKKTVINFRDDRDVGRERDIWDVPVGLLRYRKDNGRISSDVLTYERFHGKLDEKSETAQMIIRDSLLQKDPEKTEQLKRSIQHGGQDQPAIITCDGFLVNGNRRKLVIEMLHEPGTAVMKVVILPGKDESGGPPTLLEIEEIENRYQLQSEHKAEYSNFDRALSIRRKKELGMSLERQLKDDSTYAGLPEKEFKKAVKEYRESYLNPLVCIDTYLHYLKRDGLYNTIATGIGDREGRWQAFLDYYNSVYKKITDEKQRAKLGIREDEIGKVEEVAFKIIRQREIPGLPGITKVHQVMRMLPKWLENKHSKKELFNILDIDLNLPKEERFDENGQEYDERQIDRFWSEKHRTEITRQVKKAIDYFEHKKGQEKPLDLLEGALRNLEHEDMKPNYVNPGQIPKAMELARKIHTRADEIEDDLYHYQKKVKKLKEQFQH